MNELLAIAYSDRRTFMHASDGCSYTDSNVDVICRADLLAERASVPAKLIAELYKQQGDAFVKNLRGTFAIILHDKRRHVLKAWVDSKTTREIMELVKELNERDGITVILVTHDASLAEKYARRIITMLDGAIVTEVPA